MTKKAPGKSNRTGISLLEITRLFPDNETAERWFADNRWSGDISCPHCESTEVQANAPHPTMPYRCRAKDCRKRFSVKTGTVMQSSKLGYRIWAIAIYLSLTSLKGVSSMKLHRDLSITQKSAWHLAHRIREGFYDNIAPFGGPVEVDETYLGGREANKHDHKKLKAGRGTVGKTIVAGAKDRETNRINATVIGNTDKSTLHGFVEDNAVSGATVYTDDHKGYTGLPFKHESVKHSEGEYVKGDTHTNGIEGFWATLKRAPQGYLPQDESQAPATVCQRVLGAPQLPPDGHCGPNERLSHGNGGKAVALCRSDRGQRIRFTGATKVIFVGPA